MRGLNASFEARAAAAMATFQTSVAKAWAATHRSVARNVVGGVTGEFERALADAATVRAYGSGAPGTVLALTANVKAGTRPSSAVADARLTDAQVWALLPGDLAAHHQIYRQAAGGSGPRALPF